MMVNFLSSSSVIPTYRYAASVLFHRLISQVISLSQLGIISSVLINIIEPNVPSSDIDDEDTLRCSRSVVVDDVEND